jgi:hypothetical protein
MRGQLTYFEQAFHWSVRARIRVNAEFNRLPKAMSIFRGPDTAKKLSAMLFSPGDRVPFLLNKAAIK